MISPLGFQGLSIAPFAASTWPCNAVSCHLAASAPLFVHPLVNSRPSCTTVPHGFNIVPKYFVIAIKDAEADKTTFKHDLFLMVIFMRWSAISVMIQPMSARVLCDHWSHSMLLWDSMSRRKLSHKIISNPRLSYYAKSILDLAIISRLLWDRCWKCFDRCMD